MQLFEITLVLLAIAVVLLQVARHVRVPYPAMLALVGGCVAALPFAPHVSIEPRLALALFVAPAVMDTAFDMPPREMLRIWLPLTSLAVVLVLLTTAAVAWAGWALAGLPLAAAVALGAIVAPPDAGATSVPSVLGSLAAFGIGSPRASTPFDQLISMNGALTRCLPLVRSSTKK